jgi:hypothetical protein
LILKRNYCQIKDDLLNGNKRDKYSCLPHFWPPELEKEVFQAQGGVLGCSVEEKLEGSLVKLKLLAEDKLEESLVGLKLLVEEKMDPSLVKLGLLLEKRMAGSLVKLELLLEERITGSLVKLVLKHVEEKNSPQFDSPKFPLQLISEG